MENKNSKVIQTVAVYLVTKEREVLCQVRAETEIAEDGTKKKQSNPGVYQPTFNGKVEKNEPIEAAIKRECREELGDDFYKVFKTIERRPFFSKEYMHNGEKYISHEFWGKVKEKDISKIKLHSGALPELFRLKKRAKILDAKKTTLEDRVGKISMFPDQIKAVKRLFKILIKERRKEETLKKKEREEKEKQKKIKGIKKIEKHQKEKVSGKLKKGRAGNKKKVSKIAIAAEKRKVEANVEIAKK